MELKKYLEEVSALKEMELNKIKEELLKVISQSDFFELLRKMKNEENWTKYAKIVNVPNTDVKEVATMFRSVKDQYCGKKEGFGLNNEVICWVSSKPETKAGKVVCYYKKNENMYFIQDDDQTVLKESVFHPNHELIWVTKIHECDEMISKKQNCFKFGEDVKYVIHIYKPSIETIRKCFMIKEKRFLIKKEAYKKIKGIEEEAKKKINEIKREAGMPT